MISQPSLLDLMGDTGQKPKPIAGDEPETMPVAPSNAGKLESGEFELVLHYDNEVRSAIQVSETGDVNKAFWLPKSEIEFTETGRKAPATTNAGNPVPGGLPVIMRPRRAAPKSQSSR